MAINPCEMPPLDHRVQNNPCDAAHVNQGNWDEQKLFNDEVIRRFRMLNACNGNRQQVRFRLTEALPFGDDAAARILRQIADGTWELDPDNADPIQVFDDERCARFAGPADYEGWAFPRMNGNASEYTIRDMDQIAQRITYSLNEHLTGSSASADVLAHSNGCDPGMTVTVYDPLGTHKQWHRYGCLGIAQWNRDQQRYEIIDPQLVSRRWQALLQEDICPDDVDPQPPTVTLVAPYEQDKYSALLYEIDQDEESETFGQYLLVTDLLVENWIEKKGQAVKKVIIEGRYFHDDAEIDPQPDALKWEMEILETIEVKPVVEIEWQGCGLSATTEKIYVEGCGFREGLHIDNPFETVSLPTEIYLDSAVDATPERCRILADFYDYCVIPLGFSGTSNVAVFNKRPVVENVVLEHVDPEDPEDPDDHGVCRLVQEKWFHWVPCFEESGDETIFNLARHQIIDEFEHVIDLEAEPAVCKVIAHTKLAWTVVCDEAEDDGDDLDVVEFSELELLNDVYVDGLELKKAPYRTFLPCFEDEVDEVIIDLEECE